ncbi:MAG: class I tRNA ligase family protein, partial [Deltaproteobacteria bacterium]|nr:class I tRNA ligase family protein [Deltaproteobacteria bacterium]
YIGGIEHAILHLLYARFLTKVLRDLGLTTVDEPFSTLLTQGMVCKETARCQEHDYLFPEDVTREGTCRHCGQPVEIGRVEKMSKSKRNIVDPDQVIERYGADTARLFILFAAPPEKDLDWSEQGVEGCYRFLQRVWRLVTEALDAADGVAPWAGPTPPPDDELRAFRRLVHKTIRRVSTDIEERFHFNTAISAVMELVNAAYQRQATARQDGPFRRVLREALEALVLLLSPFAPHLCEELWERLGGRQGLARTRWPAYDEDAAREEEVLVVIQVNGRLRGRITVPADIPEEVLRQAALDVPKIRELTRDRAIRNVVVVPRKLVNIVTG